MEPCPSTDNGRCSPLSTRCRACGSTTVGQTHGAGCGLERCIAIARRATPLCIASTDGELTIVLPERTISNGIGWSPDGEVMYYIDSTTQRVVVFDFDLDSGELGDERLFVEIDPIDGLPDGLTVDADGGVWVCLFGGGHVRRYRPDGSLDARSCYP